MFTAFVNGMEESLRSKLIFNFKSILSQSELQKKQQADLANYQKRNNPSENDDIMLSDCQFSDDNREAVVSAKNSKRNHSSHRTRNNENS